MLAVNNQMAVMKRCCCWMAWILKEENFFFLFECRPARVWKVKVWRLKTPCSWLQGVREKHGEKQSARGELASTKARRWWEQSWRTLRLGISLHMKMGSRRLTGRHVMGAFSCRRMQVKSNCVRLNAAKMKFTCRFCCGRHHVATWGNYSRTWKTEWFFQ